MLHAVLDLSRKRLGVRVLDDAGETTLDTWTPADRTDWAHSRSESNGSGNRCVG
jgi:hypothetical protein